jgi:hypothetical protein
MGAPTIRTRRIFGLTAAPLAILFAGLLVWQGSSAAFTARTQNVGNNWETGSVTLTDDDAGAAAFSVQNATPGATGSRCLTVTSTSTVAGVVKPYVARLGAQGLENYIYIQMEQGTGGGFASCAGFVPEGTPLPPAPLSYLSTANHDFATGGTPWATTGVSGESRTYRVTWNFNTTGLSQVEIDALQGKSVSVDVVWELQNS